MLGKFLLDASDLRLQEVDRAAQARLCAGVSAMQSLPLGNEDIDQLAATLHQRGQTLALGVSHRLDEALEARVLVEHSCECRQCSSIDAVCLGKYTRSAGEIARLPRVHDRDIEAGHLQRARRLELVASGGLQHDQRRPQFNGERPAIPPCLTATGA